MLNLTVLVGRLTHNCEITKTKEDMKDMCKFTMACQPNKDAKTEFIDCIAFDQPARFIGTYGKKGMLFLLVGHVHKNIQVKADGQKVYRQTIVADRVTVLEKKREVDGYQREVIQSVGDAILNDDQYTGGIDPDYVGMYGGY